MAIAYCTDDHKVDKSQKVTKITETRQIYIESILKRRTKRSKYEFWVDVITHLQCSPYVQMHFTLIKYWKMCVWERMQMFHVNCIKIFASYDGRNCLIFSRLKTFRQKNRCQNCRQNEMRIKEKKRRRLHGDDARSYVKMSVNLNIR